MAVAIDRGGSDKWRYTCPRGHIYWKQHGDTIACSSCPHSKIPGSVRYDVIRDQKTGELLDVGEVRVE